MEQLINKLPKEVGTTEHRNEDGSSATVGLCLRWSVTRQKWACGYGAKIKSQSAKYPHVEADDPVEALALFVELRKDLVTKS